MEKFSFPTSNCHNKKLPHGAFNRYFYVPVKIKHWKDKIGYNEINRKPWFTYVINKIKV